MRPTVKQAIQELSDAQAKLLAALSLCEYCDLNVTVGVRQLPPTSSESTAGRLEVLLSLDAITLAEALSGNGEGGS